MHVKALQNFFKAHLHIVWINTPTTFTSDKVTNDRLQKFVKRFMFKDFTIHVFNHTDEEQGILQFSNQIGGNLIAMGTHGRKGLAHVLSGSLAEDVANHTENMVWTYALKKG
jgi:K+-sensing histidine kinase KdpD